MKWYPYVLLAIAIAIVVGLTMVSNTPPVAYDPYESRMEECRKDGIKSFDECNGYSSDSTVLLMLLIH